MFAIKVYSIIVSKVFGVATLIDILVHTLGHFIALSMNVSQGSIIVVDDVLYLASHSSILGILVMVCCTFYGV